MKLRTVSIFSGQTFSVPEWIQRIDTKATHGWQVRYGSEVPTKLFSDHSADGSGAEASLAKAIADLHKRVKRLPAPTRLRAQPMATKSNALPVGVSGPTLRNPDTPGRTPYYCYQISIPRVDGGSTTKSVYIGTVNTFNEQRSEAALAKALAMREDAVRKQQQARTRAKRAAAAATLSPEP